MCSRAPVWVGCWCGGDGEGSCRNTRCKSSDGSRRSTQSHRPMELGVVINELNIHVTFMDAYSYNVTIAVGNNSLSDQGCGVAGQNETVADTVRGIALPAADTGVGRTAQKRRPFYDDDAFTRPLPPLFIEPVLTSPDDYVHLGSWPKRVKLDKHYVRSTVPSIVRNTLLRPPHSVVVKDPLNALGGDSEHLVTTGLYPNDTTEVRRLVRTDTAVIQRPEPSPPPQSADLPVTDPRDSTRDHVFTLGSVSEKRSAPSSPRSVEVTAPHRALEPPVLPPPPPPPPPSSLPPKPPESDGTAPQIGVRDSLMNSILKGVTLRPVEKRQVAPSSRLSEVATALSRAIAKRRSAIDPIDSLKHDLKIMDKTDSESEDSDNTDSEKWS